MHRYQTVYRDLLGQITSGSLVPGTVLPTEPQLAKAFGVSRPTIRHALQMLESEGLVDRRKHRGTMVLESKIEQGFATSIRSFHDEMRSHNMRLVRVRHADRLPNVLVKTYVPHALYPGIETTDFRTTSLYATMRSMGAPVVRAHRKLDVALADREVATALGIEVASPVFVFHTVAQNADGRHAEYSIATYRGDTNSFEFDTRLE